MTIEPLVFQLNPWIDVVREDAKTRRFLAWYDRTLILFLGCRCNLRCIYCFAPKDLEPSFSVSSLDEQLQRAAAHGISRVVLTGGEPLLYPELDALLTRLHQAGFTGFGLQTNGMRLRDPARVAHLVASGMRFCHLSFDSPDPETQQTLAGGKATTHETILAALANLAQHAEITLSIKSVITSLNRHQILDHVALLARLKQDLGIDPMFTLTPMLPPEPQYNNLLVRYRDLTSTLQRAIEIGQEAGIVTWYHHVPFCCMGEDVKTSADWYTRDVFLGQDGALTPGNLYTKGDDCNRCSLTDVCHGFSRNYSILYGRDEFQPVGSARAPRPRRPGPSGWARPRPQGRSARVVLGTHGDTVRYHHWDQATKATSWARQEGCERVILTGPEPLLHPALPEIVATYASNGFEVWIETVGLGLQKEGPLRTLVSRGLAGVRWLHLPASAAPYRTYLRKISLSSFVTRTERVLSRSRLPVTHVFVVGAEPAAETRERMSMIRRPSPRSRARWVTSRVVLPEAWSGWLGLGARAPDSLDPVDAQLTRIAPLETTDLFRVFIDSASENPAAHVEKDFPFCTLEQWETPSGPRQELLLRVTGRCNQRCSFCSGPASLPEPELRQLRACLDRVGSLFPEVAVMLTGGEPLLRPDLPELVHAALSHEHIATVTIQTNATELNRIGGIAPSGRLRFFVSLHGATDDVYDHCTGTQGLLASALEGIRRLLTQDHPVIINCVVNRYNVDHLDDVVHAVAALTTTGTIKSLHFSILMCPEHRPEAQELLVPYPKVATRLMQARELAQKQGIPVAPLVSSTHASIPACLVAPAHRRQTEARPVPGPQETGLPKEGRRWVKAEICARCQEDPWCLGLPRPYYLRFGDSELRPIRPG